MRRQINKRTDFKRLMDKHLSCLVLTFVSEHVGQHALWLFDQSTSEKTQVVLKASRCRFVLFLVV